jgi:hypothetical protein
MALLKLAALAAAGYAGYRYLERRKEPGNPAYAAGQGAPGNFTQVRDSGPAAMRDPIRKPWTGTDEASDQSFPASDPPGNY